MNNYDPEVEEVVPEEGAVEEAASEEVAEEDNVEIILDVDIILDKISKLGVKALSKEEKDFLDNKSKS